MTIVKKLYLQLLFFFCVAIMYAQPSAEYIQKIRGNVDVSWLLSAGNNINATPLQFNLKRAQGFKNTPKNARNIALLDNSWTFYPVENGVISTKKKEVTIPYSFERNRDYVSGWFISNYSISKNKKKRYVLKLNRVELFSEVYVNGKRIGHHFGGFTPFEFDITNELKKGDNTIAIFVRDKSATLDNGKIYNQVGVSRMGSYNPNSSRKLAGGIDDNIRIEEQEITHLENIFVKTSTRNKTLEIDYEIASEAATDSKVTFEVLVWPTGEKVDLELPIIQLKKESNSKQLYKVNWENPNLWSPDHPNLYVLRATLKQGNTIDVVDTRFGFREFWVEGKQFMFNGKPTVLRGESHYRDNNHDVNYHRELFLMQKKIYGINACRIHATMPPNEIIYGADEAGILLIDQSAIWSVNKPFYNKGGDWFAKNLEKEFEEWVKRDRNNPSVVIWDVENEMLRFNFETYKWIKKFPDYINKFDTTRPINYSGAGWFNDSQEMVSLHMQEHYTRIMNDWKEKDSRPLIMGEFWVGGRSEQRLSNSVEIKSVLDRNIQEAKLYEEKLLEMRNFGVAGMMPFRISLLSLSKIPIEGGQEISFSNNTKKYTQPEVVLQKIHHALQSVTTFFWPRSTYTEKGNSLKKELVVCNDGEVEDTFSVQWKWLGENFLEEILLAPGDKKRIALALDYPKENSFLIASVVLDSKQISTDTLLIKPFVKPVLAQTKRIQVYKNESLVKTFKEVGFEAFSSETIPTVEDNVIWVFPEHANNRELTTIKSEIENYLANGGVILSLKQDQAPTWFPMKFQFGSANQANLHNYAKMGWEGLNKDLFYSTEAPIYALLHPIFKGLNTAILEGWDTFDGRVADDVFVRPSSNNSYEQGNWRTLAGGTRRENISLTEVFYGKGVLVACQLNLIENIENSQASALLVNTINYLSNRQAQKLGGKVQIEGATTAADIAKLVGVHENVFQNANAANGDWMLAFEGAKMVNIKAWKAKGGNVLVLSPKVADSFEGVRTSEVQEQGLLATKIADKAILNGVSSANFMSSKKSLVHSYFTGLPTNSEVLLQGFISNSTFWRVEDSFPVMVEMPYENDKIIISTIQFDAHPIAAQQEFLSLILTNCGVSIPFIEEQKQSEILIKKTVPITVDGNLEEWLEDMEDRLVTQFIHAQPIYLTSENTIEGPQAFDLNLSAINYMMSNSEALHIAGVIFMEQKFFGSEKYPGNKNYKQQFKLNNDIITLEIVDGVTSVWVNGNVSEKVEVKTDRLNSKEMTDATELQFNFMHASGKIKTMDHLVGETFEMKIPWSLLQTKSNSKKGKALFSLENKISKIQLPLKADSENKDNWMQITIEN